MKYKNLKTLPLESGITQEYPHSTMLFNIELKVLSRTSMTREKCTDRKEPIKSFLFAVGIVLYLQVPEDSIRKL